MRTLAGEVCSHGLIFRSCLPEPRLDPQVARDSGIDGIEALVALPTFLIVGTERDH